jgi:hypothetical protein
MLAIFRAGFGQVVVRPEPTDGSSSDPVWMEIQSWLTDRNTKDDPQLPQNPRSNPGEDK